MSDRAAIIPDMPIFGSDGALVGTVHRVSGVRILVNHVGASEADQHVIPVARVASVTDRVTLDCPAAEARAARSGGEGGRARSFAPVVWLGVGGGRRLDLWRGDDDPARVAAPRRPPRRRRRDARSAGARQAPLRGPSGAAPAPVRATGPVQASRATIATYLGSDVPARATLRARRRVRPRRRRRSNAAGKASVRGIAAVMTEHLNTKIKLAAYGGGLGAAPRGGGQARAGRARGSPTIASRPARRGAGERRVRASN